MIMNNIKLKHIIFCAFFGVLFAACNTPKKLNKVMNKLPEASAKECSVRFPIKETTDTVTVIDSAMMQAYEMEFVYLYSMLDSLLGGGVSDSVKREIVTVFQEKKVPVIKYKYITKTVESTAKLQVVKDSLTTIIDELAEDVKEKHNEYIATYYDYTIEREKAEKFKRQRNSLYWWLLLLIGLLFRRPVVRAASKLITKI
jgi:hypothetical protein